jgi:hypothetical protein
MVRYWDQILTYSSLDCVSGKGGNRHRRAQIHINDGCTAMNLEAKVTPVNRYLICNI